MVAFMAQAARVAQTQASILVRGQTGTGKELVARYIHQQSSRRQATFSAINCAALSRELMASELFGHKRGAFTGASHDRTGLLRLTHGGTLFLDEIAEMPLDIQAGLLRVLQDRCFTPLGSSEIVHTDIRLVSATHTSLRHLVQQGGFREDLLYRVRVVPLYLPPLSERAGDVEMLVWHFINQLNQENPRQVQWLHRDAMDALRAYHWPGNIRELANAMAYAHAIGLGPCIEPVDLPPELLGQAPADEHPQRQSQVPGHKGSQLSERQRMQQLLAEHQGHKQQLAKTLGVSRATLWRKLKKLGLQDL